MSGKFVFLLVAIVGASACTAQERFEGTVASVLARRCLECHNAKDARGGLNLTTRDAILAGGDSGAGIVVGQSEQSRLIKRIVTGEMPPERHGRSQRLPAAEIDGLRQWIVGGAEWPDSRVLDLFEKTNDARAGRDWWSLQPVIRRPVPKVADDDVRVVNPVDAFVMAKLHASAMTSAPPADRHTMIRRAHADLTGLPPTVAEINAFVHDESPGAYEKLLDRLLASRHHGERWARHWLDLVRFAETSGYERDQVKPGIWRYRDWVIDALNDDMPYDEFVTQQLAGDEIDQPTEQSVIATAMIRAGSWNDEPNDAQDYLYERLEDMVHTTTTAFLGLTVKCARCHDHKFDAIRQTDYYRTASFFWAGYMGQANLGGPNTEQLGFDVFGWTDRSREVPPIRLLINGERHKPGEVVQPGFLSSIPSLERPLAPSPADSRTTHRRREFAAWITEPANPLTARVFVNRLWLHHFGEGIVRTPNNFGFKSNPPTHPALLDWLASELVDGGWKIKRLHKLIMMSATYRQSSVHPQYAACAEQDSTNRLWWRFNRRRRDAESVRDAMLAVSGNLNRRMGGPSFYPKMADEALEGLSRKGTAWESSPAEERARRSIYMMTKRQRLLPLMTVFDFADTSRPCGKRDDTTVAPQALALLNNHFVHWQSSTLASRIANETDESVRQIGMAWQAVLGREPRTDELTMATEHVRSQTERFRTQQNAATSPADTGDRQPNVDKKSLAANPENPGDLALASLCHVLMNTNEFLYVD